MKVLYTSWDTGDGMVSQQLVMLASDGLVPLAYQLVDVAPRLPVAGISPAQLRGTLGIRKTLRGFPGLDVGRRATALGDGSLAVRDLRLRSLQAPFLCVENLSAHYWVDPANRRRDEDLFAAYLKPGDTVIDVGANIGALTRTAAGAVGPAGTVIGIEAHRLPTGSSRATSHSTALATPACTMSR
jgi:hypothetical protein